MSTRKIKKEVLQILQEDDLKKIHIKLQQYLHNDLISPLFSAICRGELSLRWHAISVFGTVVSQMSVQDIVASRIVMRRLLWSLNDESGGIGWGAPETMAEIMVHSEILFNEYGHMLISYMREDGPELCQDGNYLELPELQSGLLWGIARLSSVRKQSMIRQGVGPEVVHYLHSSNSNVRGMAIRCLGILGPEYAEKRLRELTEDNSAITLYLNGRFHEKSVAILAQDALRSLEEQ